VGIVFTFARNVTQKSVIMKKLFIYTWTLVICLLSVACQTTKILTANFEGDVIDAPPAKDLPGDPVGDFIEYNEALDPLLKVKSSTLSGTKALDFENLTLGSTPASQRWISFKGKGTNLAQPLWMWHTGEFSSVPGEILIELTDGYGVSMTRMRISTNGEVSLPRNTDEYSSGEFTDILGDIETGPHTIIFTVSPSTLRYNVSIFRSPGSPITAENRPMMTDNALNFHNPAYPTLAIRHKTYGLNNVYTIGSVTISRKKP